MYIKNYLSLHSNIDMNVNNSGCVKEKRWMNMAVNDMVR